MLVQNVQTNNQFAAGIFSVSGENVKANKDGIGNGFASLFDTLTNIGKVNTEVTGQSTVDNQSTAKSDEKASSIDNKQNFSKTSDSADTKETVKAEAATPVKTDKSNNSEVTTDDIEKVSACLVQVTITVAEFFSISTEDLTDLLDKFGMNFADLTDMNQVQALFVNVKCEGDATNLLMNSDLLDSCKELLQTVTNILEKFGLNTEEINNVLESMYLSGQDFDDVLAGAVKEAVVGAKTESKTEAYSTENTDYLQADAFESKVVVENVADSKQSKNNSNRNDNRNESTDSSLYDKFMNHMVNTVKESISELSELANVSATLREISDQILNQIRVNVTEDTRSLEIQLTPEHLGKVNVTVEESNGVLTAKFSAENQTAKEAIETSLIQFKEQLAEQGLKVDHIEVTVSDFAFDKNKDANQNEQEQNKGHKKHFTLEEINEIVDGKDLKSQSYIDNGISTVNYVA